MPEWSYIDFTSIYSFSAPPFLASSCLNLMLYTSFGVCYLHVRLDWLATIWTKLNSRRAEMSINWCVSCGTYIVDNPSTMREIFSNLPLSCLFCTLLFEPFWESSADPRGQQVVTTPTSSLNSCAISHVGDILYIIDDFHICSCSFHCFAARQEISLIFILLEILVLFTLSNPTFNSCTMIICVVLLLHCYVKLVSYKNAL